MPSGDAFLRELRHGAAAIVIAEERLTGEFAPALIALLSEQPPWSDLPAIILSGSTDRGDRLQTYSPFGNVSVLAYPVTLVALVSAAEAAIRARRRQYQVRDLLKDKEMVARQKDEFLAMLAHELRNPLAPVRTTLQVLSFRHPDDRDTQNAVQVAERSVRHLAHLIDDLLDASRVTLGRFKLKAELVDAADALRFAAVALRPSFQEKGVELHLDLPGAVLPVIGDPTRLEQALTNVLDNAAKYTPAGGAVRVRAETSDGEVLLSVEDNGDGIDPADLPYVFDLFSQRSRPLDRTGGGLGVGLTIVKGLVELHGGRVAISSPGIGRGTTVEIRLPLCPEATLPRPTATEHPKIDRLKVLVVDDNRDGADSLATFLTLVGCETRTAYDGREAIDAFREFHPEAVLLDIGLPGLNGYEVAEHIRTATGDGVMLVAVTGYGRDEDRARGAVVGFDHHLVKPVDLESVGRLLTSAVRSGRTP
jgi:signal transduction histidine kinase/ActR/RegA family two-component response regulator